MAGKSSNGPSGASPAILDAPGPDDSREQALIASILHADNGDPFAALGLHEAPADQAPGLILRTFHPDAARAWVIEGHEGRNLGELRKCHPAGFFAGLLPHGERFPYRLRFEIDGRLVEEEDPYRFPLLLGTLDLHLIAEGNHLRLYDRLGAHPTEIDGIEGTAFAVWAPNARRVSVVGNFNRWDGRRHPMRKRVESGVWELFLPGVRTGASYKYEIKAADGMLLPLKADPCAFQAEHPPATASVVRGLPHHDWSDRDWLTARHAKNERNAPISIYECHLGSWMRRPEEGNRYLTYDELGDRLIPYVVDMGFTHLELLPINEYPFDGSWGYQPIGLYAPTSRFGDPEAFARFMDRCHAAGIGVLLDWVPGHFPTDAHGLGYFDGTHLYEHADPRLGFHQDWNTLIYNFGRREVCNFLLANALFWLDRYHADGLRVDAVASMLYLDYSRAADQWIPNRYGGNENLEAIDFLKRMNELLYREHPGATSAAEESTAWPGVSRPVYLGGLGFGYKWNMGWMHDTLNYISQDPLYRRYHHHNITFGLLYAFSENFILPLSHDEVVHGKGSLLGKMPGDRWQKFANLRAYLGFMWTHPGKKLLFMGGEFGQEREWNHDAGLDWHLLDDPSHRGLQSFVRDLNRLYRSESALHRLDCQPEGFEWIEGNDSDNSVLSFLRRAEPGGSEVVVLCNFTPIKRENYRVGVPTDGYYRECLNSDSAGYGGSGVGNGDGVEAESIPWHGRPYSLSLTLPPLAAVVLRSDHFAFDR